MSVDLKLSGVTVRRSSQIIVEAAGFTAPGGRVTGLIGPNGAGKSTLVAAIMGLHTAEAGTIALGEVDFAALDRRTRARTAAYVEQAAGTEDRLSVADVVALGRIPHASLWSPQPAPNDERIAAAALERVGMTAFSKRLYATLSGGEQQRVQLARALTQEPRLLLLDEPTSHLDIRGQLQVLDLLRAEARSGMTVLVVLHDLNLALSRCDWLVVMQWGRVVAEGRPVDVLTERLIAEVYGVSARLIAGPRGPTIGFEEPV